MLKVTVIHPMVELHNIVDLREEICLIKDKENIFDPKAIKAIFPDHPEFEGVYIANSPHTTVDGTITASKIYDIVPDKFIGKVSDYKTVMLRNKRLMKVLVLEIDEDTLCC